MSLVTKWRSDVYHVPRTHLSHKVIGVQLFVTYFQNSLVELSTRHTLAPAINIHEYSISK